MKITNMSDYDRYIILADSSGKYHPDYQSFLNFNRIQKALSKIGSSQSSNYLYKDDIYDKPITSSEARQILQNFNEFKYEKVNDPMNIPIAANGTINFKVPKSNSFLYL